MALEVNTLASTGATLAVGSNIVFDTVTIGGSTGKVEVVKIGDGTAGSSGMVAASSGSALDGIGLQVNVVNSSKTPIGVVLTGGQSSVSVASLPALSTASKIQVELSTTLMGGSSANPVHTFVDNQSSVTISGAVPVTDNAGSLTVDFSTASKGQMEIVSGIGASTGSPLFVNLQQFNANSTFASTVVTSTTAITLFSSGGSTRFIITDLEIMNQGATIVMAILFDGSTSGTVIDRTYCATAGGGKSAHYITPIYNTTGNAITFQIDAGSTVTVNARGYRSS